MHGDRRGTDENHEVHHGSLCVEKRINADRCSRPRHAGHQRVATQLPFDATDHRKGQLFAGIPTGQIKPPARGRHGQQRRRSGESRGALVETEPSDGQPGEHKQGNCFARRTQRERQELLAHGRSEFTRLLETGHPKVVCSDEPEYGAMP